MPKRYPHLSHLLALSYFEAAARCESFTRAAVELCVTQAAVSRQIRQLECALGFVLFERQHRAVTLTAKGRQLYQVISGSFAEIDLTVQQLRRAERPAVLTIAATYAVATYWLSPWLPLLRERFGFSQVQVIASDSIAALEGRFDLAIRYGQGDWPGYRSLALGPCEVFPVCSPRYLAREPLSTLADLAGAALLHLEDPRTTWLSWQAWFALIHQPMNLPKPTLWANHYTFLLQAAINDQGIALGWRQLVSDLLASGALMQALPVSAITPQRFYLLCAEEQRCDWLDEVQEWAVESLVCLP